MSSTNQISAIEIDLESHDQLFRTALELAQYFQKLTAFLCHGNLLNGIDFLQKIVDHVIPIPYQIRCMCPLHLEMFGFLPASFFLSLLNEIKEAAVFHGVNLTTVIVEEILISIRAYLSTTPVHVQVWCSLEPVPYSPLTSH